MAVEIEQLIARLSEGETFEGLLRSFLPQAEQDLLKCCAVVRKFDEHIVDEVLRNEVSGATKEAVPFENLSGQSFVEPVTGLEGFYQLRESARKEYFELWQKGDELISPGLRALSGKLVSYYERLGAGWELDVLYHLIASDSERAEKEFNRLYDEADLHFDLGRCQDLLKILEGRHTILSPNLLQLFKERQYYLSARGLWSREYYQTVYYYEIEQLEQQFQKLLQDESKWILQLYARGGLGKTMFLRWLVARRCVPQPAKIPCARIDFDFIDPKTATQSPWMLFLEIAQQLNQQIPDNIFVDAIGDLKEFKPILTRSESPTQDYSKLQTAAERRARLQEIPSRFVDALVAAKLKNRVVLIFDTLEEVILTQGTNMMALLAEIEKLHDSYPNICLILSGRYDLEDKLEGFKEKYGAVSQTLPLQRFSDQDARRYLTEKRGITRLLDPVIRRAQGNPFQLSLYADILRSNPRITTREIESFPSGLLYLIKRILSRIPDKQVRWLLRYGVVPRKLRLSFVEEVMAPYLPQAMSGASRLDDPAKGLAGALASENPFQKAVKSSRSKVDVPRLWQTLTQYASGNSWVSPDSEDNTLSFHPEVLKPMRQWLRDQLIFCKLHRAAIRYYEKKARLFPHSAGQWIQEAVYHRFQLEGVKAGAYWRKQLNNPLIAQKPQWVQALAREIVDLTAQAADGEAPDSLVDKALRCEAYFEVAQANIEIARANEVDASDQLWHEASKDYHFSAELQKGLKKRVIPRACMSYVQAAILISQKDLTAAHAVLESALKLKAKSEHKIKLTIEYADSLSRLGQQREAGRHYRAALKLAPIAKLKSSQVIEIRKRLASHYEHLGESNKAIQEFKVALTLAKKSKNPVAALELSRRLAEVHLAVGQIEKALEYADAFPEPSWGEVSGEQLAKYDLELLRRTHLKGRIELETRASLAALSTWVGLLNSIEESISAGRADKSDLNQLFASTHEHIGLAYGELMDVSKALDELEEARISYKNENDDASVNRCLLHMIYIQLRVARNIKRARLLLDQVNRLSLPILTEAATQQELVRIAVLDQSGRQLTAQRRRRRLSEVSKRDKWSAPARAAIALAGVTHRARTGAAISLRESVATLRHVRPPSQRITLLNEMRWCPTPKKVLGKLSTSFANLFPAPDCKTPFGALNALKIADALRIVGKKLSPRSLLEGAQETFTDTDELFRLLEVYRAWDRLGWPHQNVSAVSSEIARFLEAYSNYPQVCLVVRLEHVKRLLKFKEFALAQEMLNQAERLMDDKPGTYWMGYFNELSGRLLIERHWSSYDGKAKLDKSQREVWKQGMVLLIRAKSAYNLVENRLASKQLDRYTNAKRKRLDAALLATAAAARSKGKKPGKLDARAGAVRKKKIAPSYPGHAEKYAETILRDRGYSVRLRRPANAKTLTIQTDFANRSTPAKKVVLKRSKGLSEILSAAKGDMFSRPFVSMFWQEWLSISDDMFSALMTEDEISQRVFRRKSASSFDLGLDIEDMSLAGLPWEFALLGPFKETDLFSLSINCFYRTTADTATLSWAIKFLQAALQRLYPQMARVDGFYGPDTVQAVQVFQRQNELPVTGLADRATMKRIHEVLRGQANSKGVLVVQPSTERQIKSGRGHGSSGLDLPSMYSRLCFKVEVLEYPTMSGMATSLSASKPQIIHLCPLMKRSPTIGFHLNFGTAKNEFSLSGLGKLLDIYSYSQNIKPVVILDVPRPPVFSETVAQLMIRNAFASELFRMGNTSAVFATGLSEQLEQQRPLTKILISSLAEELPFGEIVNKIRGMSHEYLSKLSRKEFAAPETLDAIIGSFGTALFTQDPRAWLL